MFKISQHIVRIFFACWALLMAPAFAADMPSAETNQELMAKGMWKDPETGLIWFRCAVGQKWNGSNCKGEILFNRWYLNVFDTKAMRLGGYADWRIPTIYELSTIRKCKLTDREGMATIPAPDGASSVPRKCTSSAPFNTVDGYSDDNAFFDVEVFPIFPLPRANSAGELYSIQSATFKKSSSGSTDYMWQMKRSGAMWDHQPYWKFKFFIAMAVRGTTASAEYSDTLLRADTASKEAMKFEAEQDRENAQRRVADENARKIQAQKVAALSLAMNQNDSQAMYLAAGKYERNGEISDAKKIYERVIDKFPSSTWAVKANDQLNAINRQSRAESAAQQRQLDNQRGAEDSARQERINCGVRISMCEDHCPRDTARSSCQANCANMCRQF